MATLAGIILGVVVAVYATLTILPVYHLDCPYRTPLSGMFWHIHLLTTSIANRWRSRSELPPSLGERRKETMVESVFRKATENLRERSTRDTKALLWTLKSLTDDVELEPFVEALPLIIWGTDSLSGADERRYVYDDRIRPLMENSEAQLLLRIESLLESCDTGLLSLEVSKRRRISCYKAVWALSSLAIAGASDPEAVPYAVSATAMQQWAGFHSAQSFDDILKLLNQCRDDILANRTPNLTLLRSYLWTLDLKYHTHLDTHVEVHSSVGSAMDSLLLMIDTLLEEVSGLSFTIPFRLALEYIDEAQASSVIPYQFFRQLLSFWYPIVDAEDSLPLLLSNT
ncbi:hypothetical protein C8R47DRAFT_1290077 [Mycena vitilis]|nr:hypothetical protein C8R47DRAFT_1290077 [Mycena vitilis]